MTNGQLIGIVGGVVGSLIGVLGAAVGVWCSVKRTNGPSERAFMIRAAAWMTLGVGVFLAGLLLLPTPYNHLLWAPYVLVLLLGIRWCNRTQARIRREEHTPPESSPPDGVAGQA